MEFCQTKLKNAISKSLYVAGGHFLNCAQHYNKLGSALYYLLLPKALKIE